MMKILVVDDDTTIRTLLAEFLAANHYEVESSHNTDEARKQLLHCSFDLIILDIMLPDMSGLDFLSELRRSYTTPVLMLTARDQLQDKILGFEQGADDYLTKPFEPLELLARVRNIVRRHQFHIQTSLQFFGSDFCFDKATGLLFWGEKEIPLSSTEKLLLGLFCANPFKTFSRTSIAHHLGYTVSERTVDVQINRLRKKFRQYNSTMNCVQTVRHQGYKLIWV